MQRYFSTTHIHSSDGAAPSSTATAATTDDERRRRKKKRRGKTQRGKNCDTLSRQYGERGDFHTKTPTTHFVTGNFYATKRNSLFFYQCVFPFFEFLKLLLFFRTYKYTLFYWPLHTFFSEHKINNKKK